MGDQIDVSRSIMLKQADGVLSADVDEDVIIMNMESGKFYGLDDIGRSVWEFIAQPRPVHEVCEHLLAEYEVDRETCEASLLKLVESLVDARLVEKVAA